MPDLLLRVLGVLLVVAVGVDVFRTVLLPSSRGTTDRVLSELLWRSTRITPGWVRPHARRASGPLSLVLTSAAWYGALLVGFALLYLPTVDDLSYTPGVPFGGKGLAEALYLSGTSLTTVGFGDVVGATSTVRLLNVVEAASGLGVLTATLGYLPTIYSLVSELRTANQAVADLGSEVPEAAAELLGVDAVLVLESVRRDVLASRQHLQRFPVLHTFHPDYDESVVALVRSAAGLWVAGHFVEDADKPLGRHLTALGTALRRLVDELAAHTTGHGTDLDPEAAFERAREVSPHGHVARDIEVSPDDVALLKRLHEVLDAYARSHDYPAATTPGAGSTAG
ncbi:MAG: two pore domain potassium channel family protein [Frankiales bacterium]|nr:two pore domain potassium channel family protein [Frankiales bacterium]